MSKSRNLIGKDGITLATVYIHEFKLFAEFGELKSGRTEEKWIVGQCNFVFNAEQAIKNEEAVVNLVQSDAYLPSYLPTSTYFRKWSKQNQK